jgi:hypothetical protein
MLFDTVVSRCIEEALVKGEGFAIDASLVRADVARQRAEPGPVDWTPSKVQSRAVKEYLAKLDQEADLNRPQKSVSLTDPMAQWSSAQGRAQFFYSTNYLIDTEHGVIMDVEASPSTLSLEVATTRTMIERVESTHAIKPRRLMGDTAYGAAKNLGYLIEEKNIEPHVPVQNKSKDKQDTFSINDFQWDAEADHYRCPGNHTLVRNLRKFTVPRTGITKAGTIIYRAHQADCKVCPLKPQCCPNTTHRKIARSIYEESRSKTRAINETDEYRTKSFHERKKVEMLFAHMKRNLRFTRLRLRGLASANDEFLMMATVQNLRRMARLCARPPPDHGVTAPGDLILA